MAKSINELGNRYGRLTVVDADLERFGKNKYETLVWVCECDCGGEQRTTGWSLRSGKIKSCGCLVGSSFTHGHTRGGLKTPTYTTWCSMRQRCNNPNNNAYDYYGGRGISICKRWDTFEYFVEDMGIRPEGTSIDRLNHNGNYEPGNCRWATPKQQAENKHVPYD